MEQNFDRDLLSARDHTQ